MDPFAAQVTGWLVIAGALLWRLGSGVAVLGFSSPFTG
jgi:hypothetical protein